MSGDIPDYYWKNLLAITTRAQADDPTERVEREIPKVLDGDSRKWLEEVMRDLVHETDPFRQLQKVIDSLHQYASSIEKINESDNDQILDLIERLDDLLSIADLSKQFINNGGLLILETFIMGQNVDFEIRVRFAQVILTWAENNEIAQNAIIDSKLFNELLTILSNPETPSGLLSAILSAISGSVRSNKSAFSKFEALNGSSILENLVKSSKTVQVSAKSARILTSISYTMQDYPEFAKKLNIPIIGAYILLVSNGEHFAELEYIREYLLNYVEWADVEEKLRNELLTSLDLENRRDLDQTNRDLISKLCKKFGALRTG